LVIIIFCLSVFSACFFGAGSYANAEYYTFEVSENELINNIDEFKKTNKEYTQVEFKDNLRDGFYAVYFFLPDKNTVLMCTINMYENNNEIPSAMGLSSAYFYTDKFHPWKDINTKGISKEENKKIKKIFETEILDKLGIKWKHKKWYN
jgi:hypothetical protein